MNDKIGGNCSIHCRSFEYAGYIHCPDSHYYESWSDRCKQCVVDFEDKMRNGSYCKYKKDCYTIVIVKFLKKWIGSLRKRG